MPTPELELYRRQFEQLDQQALEVTAGLDEARFNWRPAPADWSIEECLAHLTMVGQWEVRALEKAIDQGKERGLTGEGPFEYGPVDRFIVHQSEPPVRNAMSAPKHFIPVHGQPVTAILPTFQHVQSQLVRQVERADGLHLRRVKVVTPILPFLKMSLGATFAAIAAHERRHLDQAWRVREKLPQ